MIYFQLATLLRASINPDIRMEEAAPTIVDVFVLCERHRWRRAFFPTRLQSSEDDRDMPFPIPGRRLTT